MQTSFSPAQLQDPKIAEANQILRKCVHCGFCTATCPTYVLLGDELDSPRGRIYLIKDMLENARPATAEVVKHIDRCLSCLACMTTCPSGVNYMHLIDQARVHVERTYRRPLFDRALRRLLAFVMPDTERFRSAMKVARWALPLRPLWRALPGFSRLDAALALVPPAPPPVEPLNLVRHSPRGGRAPCTGGAPHRLRAAGAKQLDQCRHRARAHAPRRRSRHPRKFGLLRSVDPPPGDGARRAGAGAPDDRSVDARKSYRGELDAIIVNASGCGTVIKDYGYLFAHEPAYRAKAAKVASLAKDITEFLERFKLVATAGAPLRVAYHSACSMQHGQQLHEQPKRLLRAAGFQVLEAPEGHLCCGSAGTYNILQPEIADRLRIRKLQNIESTAPDIIATGNIGCITQLASGTAIPIVHTVELLDWVTGGPQPFPSEAIKRPEWRGSR